MKRLLFALAALLVYSGAADDSVLDRLNELGYGKLSLRLQSLTMYRDFEANTPDDAFATTLGVRLGYTSEEWKGLSLGAVYDYVAPAHASDESEAGTVLLSNGRVSNLTEGWLQLRLTMLDLDKTTLSGGRMVINGEVFRRDEFRHTPRSLEAIVLTTGDIPDTLLSIGHARKMSNWIANEDAWTFNDFGEDVFKVGYETDGVSWAEAVYTGIDQLEFAVFDAYAYDIANLAGARARYAISESTALTCLYRHEGDVGDGSEHEAEVFAGGIQQKVRKVNVETGYFGVRGDNLKFQETTTGINHPLGASMIICPSMFFGEADTAYIKATTTVGKTALYTLYSYTWHDHSLTPFNGQEVNVVVKQPVTDHLSVAVKVGAGHRDRKDGSDDSTSLDSRLFVTYTF